jgi:hypothetical protein
VRIGASCVERLATLLHLSKDPLVDQPGVTLVRRGLPAEKVIDAGEDGPDGDCLGGVDGVSACL